MVEHALIQVIANIIVELPGPISTGGCLEVKQSGLQGVQE